MQIETNLFARQIAAKKVSNFAVRLPNPQSDLANYLMKDPYIFDMMGQTEKMTERDVERQLVSHITKYLLKMGSGFAFVAQQKHFEIGESDFYADLILYNIQYACIRSSHVINLLTTHINMNEQIYYKYMSLEKLERFLEYL